MFNASFVKIIFQFLLLSIIFKERSTRLKYNNQMLVDEVLQKRSSSIFNKPLIWVMPSQISICFPMVDFLSLRTCSNVRLNFKTNRDICPTIPSIIEIHDLAK